MQSSTNSTFNQGTKFEMTGRNFTVSHSEPQFELVMVRDDKSGDKIEFKFSQLVEGFTKGLLKFKNLIPANDAHEAVDLDEYSYMMLDPKDRKFVDKRFGYVNVYQKCQAEGVRTKEAIGVALKNHACANEHKTAPDYSTVRRWSQKLMAAKGMRTSLLRKPRRPSKKYCQKKLQEAELTEAAITCALKHCYLTREKPTVMNFIRALEHLIEYDERFKGAKCPSQSTLYRRVRELPEYEKVLRRDGYLKASRDFPTGRDVYEPTYFLEEVELDHTQFDVEVVDEETRVIPLGRPWLTKLICRLSRVELGFYITMEAPSFKSVMHAVRHAIMSKDYIKTRYPDIQNKWPCMGMFRSLIVDNGMDLHGADVQANLAEICEVRYAPKGFAHYKGRVERMFGTTNVILINGVPGKTESNYMKNGDYKSDQEAVLTLEELTELYTHWVVDDYHTRFHEGLGDAPLNYWMSNPDKNLGLELPKSIDALDRLLWKRPKIKPKLQKYGLELNSMKYKSEALMDIARQHGFKIEMDVFFDEEDISWIKVVVPGTKELITVPCKALAYRENGISLKEYKLVKAEAKRKAAELKLSGKSMYSDEALQAAFARVKDKKEQAIATTKKARRKAARSKALNSADHSGTKTATIGSKATTEQSQCLEDQDNVFNIDHIQPAEEK